MGLLEDINKEAYFNGANLDLMKESPQTFVTIPSKMNIELFVKENIINAIKAAKCKFDFFDDSFDSRGKAVLSKYCREKFMMSHNEIHEKFGVHSSYYTGAGCNYFNPANSLIYWVLINPANIKINSFVGEVCKMMKVPKNHVLEPNKRELPTKARDLIKYTLYYELGLTMAEIGRVVHVSTDGLRGTLSRINNYSIFDKHEFSEWLKETKKTELLKALKEATNQ